MYRVRCPECGSDRLYVVSGHFYGSIPLEPDGFDLTEADYLDTSDEQVECSECGWMGSLDDLDGEAEPEANVEENPASSEASEDV